MATGGALHAAGGGAPGCVGASRAFRAAERGQRGRGGEPGPDFRTSRRCSASSRFEEREAAAIALLYETASHTTVLACFRWCKARVRRVGIVGRGLEHGEG